MSEKKNINVTLVIHCNVGSFGNQNCAMDKNDRLPPALCYIRPTMRRRSSFRNEIKPPLFHARIYQPTPIQTALNKISQCSGTLGLLIGIHTNACMDYNNKNLGIIYCQGVLKDMIDRTKNAPSLMLQEQGAQTLKVSKIMGTNAGRGGG